MKPVLALAGRPNVGKSTLFNRLTRTRDALVADVPGLIRDRQYGQARHDGRAFMVVDTGGIGEGLDGVVEPVTGQARQALEEADAVLFLVDGRAGLNAADEQLAAEMRALGKPVHLVVNKTDGLDPDVACADFHALGLGVPHPVAATHGRGVRALLDAVLADFPQHDAEDLEKDDSEIRVTILGRPNVGKSTLLNRMLGEERVVVFDESGTTRDAIHVPLERHGRRYRLIDTAGVRRRGRVYEAVEKFSVIKAMQAVEAAHVVVLVVDARDGLTDQDLHLLAHVLEAGRSLVVALNKWDGLSRDERLRVRQQVGERLGFAPWIRVQFTSALHGTGVGDLYELIDRAHASAFLQVGSARLTRLLEDLVSEHPPPVIGRHRPRPRYAHPGGSNPPRIVVHGNKVAELPDHYRRYLENRFRELLELEGTPLRVECRSGENPWAGRRNALTPRQQRRRRRLMRHVRRR